MLTEKQISILNRNEWEVDYYENETSFSVSHKDGSSIESCNMALDYLIEELSDEEDVSPKTPSTDEILEHYGFYVACESPFEIGRNDNDKILVTGFAARVLFHNLRNKFCR